MTHSFPTRRSADLGFIDRERSTVIQAPNIAWRNEPLRAVLEARLDAPVFIENDANAAGWGEFRFGAGRGRRDLVMLTMGTGVGGAVVADGALYRGGPGIGGEPGPTRSLPTVRPCGSGHQGSLHPIG